VLDDLRGEDSICRREGNRSNNDAAVDGYAPCYAKEYMKVFIDALEHKIRDLRNIKIASRKATGVCRDLYPG